MKATMIQRLSFFNISLVELVSDPGGSFNFAM